MIKPIRGMTPVCRQIIRLLVGPLTILVCAGDVAHSQDDGQFVEPVEANPQAVLARARAERVRQVVRMHNQALEQQLVSRMGIGRESHETLEKRLASRIGELRDLYQLTEPQVKKLRLAGRGDIKRFMDRLDSLVKGLAREDSSEDSGLALEVRALEKTRERLFDEGSLFSKTVVNTLSPDQLARIEEDVRHNNLRLYRDAVTQAARGLAGLANLSSRQMEELANLILTETRPPRRFGQSDYALVMFQVSRLPESRLEPIFLEAQWKVLKLHFASWNDAEQFLKSEGFVFDDTPAAPAARPRAVGGRIAEIQLKEGTHTP